MHAKITKRWKAAPPGKVYPRYFEEGEVIEGEFARQAIALGVAEETSDTAGDPPSGEDSGDTDAGKQSEPPPRKAKVTKQGEFEHDGKTARFAKGATVEGDVAAAMVAAGFAAWLDDKAAAPKA